MSRRSIVAAGSALAGAGLSEAFARATKASAEAGGGVIHVPPEIFVTGPVTLGSNTVLLVDAGAVLKGSPVLSDYPVEAAGVSGESSRAGLVTARDAENVAITGRGVIDGNGMGFQIAGQIHQGGDWDRKYTRQKDAYMDPKFGTETGPFAHRDRPGNLLRFTANEAKRLERQGFRPGKEQPMARSSTHGPCPVRGARARPVPFRARAPVGNRPSRSRAGVASGGGDTMTLHTQSAHGRQGRAGHEATEFQAARVSH